jgi:hydrogenase maturation protease
MKTQIIGCGNPARMDDAAGVLVASHLRRMGINTEIQSGGAFELVASWERQKHVMLIDAVMTGAPTGTIQVWEGRPPRLPHARQFSSHGFGLAEAFRLGQVLSCLPRQITVYGIEGRDFGLGKRVSPEVLIAAKRVALQIAKRLGEYAEQELEVQSVHSAARSQAT